MRPRGDSFVINEQRIDGDFGRKTHALQIARPEQLLHDLRTGIQQVLQCRVTPMFVGSAALKS